MWTYERRLQYPVNIRKTCPKTAQLIISQYGGPDGELSASMRYLAQRYSMPVKKVGGLLTDIGTEELAHMEIIQSTVFNSSSTLVSIIAGALILGEPLRWYHFLCGALILAGVMGLILAPAKAENAGKSLEDDMKKKEN